EADGRRECEHVRRVAGLHAAREERIDRPGAARGGAVQDRRLVERSGLAAVRVAALILFAAVEDAVADAKDGLGANVISDAKARSDVLLVPRDQVTGDLADRNRDIWERRGEIRRKSRALIRPLRNVQGQSVEIEVRLTAEALVDRREELITNAHAHRQFRCDLPVVLSEERVPPLLRRNEV